MKKFSEIIDEKMKSEDYIFQLRVRDEDVPQSELLDKGYIDGQHDAYKNFIKLIEEFPNDKCPEFIKKKILAELK